MSGRPTRGDWAVAAGLTLLSVLAPRAGGPTEAEPDAAWVGLLGFGLAVAQGLPLAWRRIRPTGVAAVVVVAYAGYGLLVDPAPPYAGWVALFAVAAHVPGQLGVEVTDRGGGRPGPVSASGGHGLVGMRERVEMLHGTLEAGPLDGGGWTVRASLPLQEEIGE